jgi:hypothetical protein
MYPSQKADLRMLFDAETQPEPHKWKFAAPVARGSADPMLRTRTTGSGRIVRRCSCREGNTGRNN